MTFRWTHHFPSQSLDMFDKDNVVASDKQMSDHNLMFSINKWFNWLEMFQYSDIDSTWRSILALINHRTIETATLLYLNCTCLCIVKGLKIQQIYKAISWKKNNVEQIDKKTSLVFYVFSICFQVQCCEVFCIERFVNLFGFYSSLCLVFPVIRTRL